MSDTNQISADNIKVFNLLSFGECSLQELLNQIVSLASVGMTASEFESMRLTAEQLDSNVLSACDFDYTGKMKIYRRNLKCPVLIKL